MEVAKGRVWTGEDAKALGLVDELGGFPAALRLAREAAGISAENGIRMKVFPPRRPRWRTFLEDLLDPRRDGASEVLVRLLETVQPVARIAEDMGIGSPPGGLTMEDEEPRW